MSDLRELYLEMVTDHAKNPRHRGKTDPCDCIGTGHNPLCGDKIVVTISLDGETINDVKFDGEGCAISTASSDLMSEVLRGKTIQDAKDIFHGFHELVAGDGTAENVPKGIIPLENVRVRSVEDRDGKQFVFEIYSGNP